MYATLFSSLVFCLWTVYHTCQSFRIKKQEDSVEKNGRFKMEDFITKNSAKKSYFLDSNIILSKKALFY